MFVFLFYVIKTLLQEKKFYKRKISKIFFRKGLFFFPKTYNYGQNQCFEGALNIMNEMNVFIISEVYDYKANFLGAKQKPQ